MHLSALTAPPSAPQRRLLQVRVLPRSADLSVASRCGGRAARAWITSGRWVEAARHGHASWLPSITMIGSGARIARRVSGAHEIDG